MTASRPAVLFPRSLHPRMLSPIFERPFPEVHLELFPIAIPVRATTNESSPRGRGVWSCFFAGTVTTASASDDKAGQPGQRQKIGNSKLRYFIFDCGLIIESAVRPLRWCKGLRKARDAFGGFRRIVCQGSSKLVGKLGGKS